MPVKISVIVPSYNQAQFLDETLRSVISQREYVHELFVLDGGSTDGSADIIRQHASSIDFWVSEKDKGQSDAIRRGFAMATGDVICWLNSDDVFLPGALRRVQEAFDQHPSWQVLTSYHVRIDGDSRITGVYHIPGESAAWARWGILHATQPTCFFRRDLYEKVGRLDVVYHISMDIHLWLRFFDAGAVWGHLPEYLSAFRVHEASKGTTRKVEWKQEEARLEKLFPQYHAKGLARFLGSSAYRFTQILSGRYPMAYVKTRLLRGRPLEDVFGKADAATAASPEPPDRITRQNG